MLYDVPHQFLLTLLRAKGLLFDFSVCTFTFYCISNNVYFHKTRGIVYVFSLVLQVVAFGWTKVRSSRDENRRKCYRHLLAKEWYCL